MKHRDSEKIDLVGESGEFSSASSAVAQSRLHAVQERLQELGTDGDPIRRADLQMERGYMLTSLDRDEEAWGAVRPTIDVYIEHKLWERAVQAYDILFRCDQELSLSALGQGVWLAVTFPIDPELTLTMLQHIVDETPDNSDGGAVAASTAAYVVDLRASEPSRGNLYFFAMQMLGTVARRHGGVSNQQEFDAWMKKLELNDPAKFLVRLRNVIDVMVQDDWWFDREKIQKRLPVN